jgi:hypothetical protein
MTSPGITRKQAAQIMNVSERMVSMASTVLHLRPDLEPAIMAGTMSMNAAYCLATGKPKPTSWDRLVRAWNNATDDDRANLLAQIGGAA